MRNFICLLIKIFKIEKKEMTKKKGKKLKKKKIN